MVGTSEERFRASTLLVHGDVVSGSFLRPRSCWAGRVRVRLGRIDSDGREVRVDLCCRCRLAVGVRSRPRRGDDGLLGRRGGLPPTARRRERLEVEGSSSPSLVVLERIGSSLGDIRDCRSCRTPFEIGREGVASELVPRNHPRAHPRRREVLELERALEVGGLGERRELAYCRRGERS